MELRDKLATEISNLVKPGQTIGFGTATTAELIIKKIGERVAKEGIKVRGVSTSLASTEIALKLGIDIISLYDGLVLDWCFDGADEVDPHWNLIKGRGGALLKEKIIAKSSKEFVLAVTEDKLVQTLGSKYALPIEIIPSSLSYVSAELLKLGVKEITKRTGSNFYGPLFSESGNLILDCTFPKLDVDLGNKIKLITGVVEHGLFSGFSNMRIFCCSNKDGEVSSLVRA